MRLIELVRLEGFADTYPKALSGGMRQRVAIARALANNPRVLLMDEPFGALDAQTRALMQELLLDVWNRDGRTVVFVTHDIDEAIFLADRVLIMSHRPGRIRLELPVPLPRPRGYALLATPDFGGAQAAGARRHPRGERAGAGTRRSRDASRTLSCGRQLAIPPSDD